MKIKPLGDRVMIKTVEEEERTEGGIIIPDTASKEKPQQGEIVAVGAGKTNDDGKTQPMSVTVGDKVLYSKYGGSEITLEGEDYLIMRESDILAILK